ncbi:hypothetical protein BV924_14365 [Pectobacterium odoriferum]|uniref:Uncharacterized protein n=1 Tax=Pectobacterium odoriferum TaxID=78398 RepID=A0ABD6VP04_9GAMM|nr:hypothetical protein [Pectobacterium odoriferum]POD94406.1 hypothetical protein BVY06_15815 [Pectobacterium odoriferum]POE12004.1 hypothetical protein BV924_14365 [Pectobacterium odoriferum]POE25779.1 hypothetical protein BV926_13835 [Pectobacterium odoriferum]POE30332.1 hypothetical protein BV919_14390 [Pectobacterium odoriferum]POE39215.1 hypothetical protein BV920_12770 [Pectobacterium odoriferum]
MDIQEYFTKLNADSQSVFIQSLSKKENLGKLHHLSSCIYEFSNFVRDPQEKIILETVSAQLESANYSLIIGLYRQAFSSMRLAFEMGLAAIYFSARKLEMHEWLDGRMDIKWSKLIDEENGVLSKRFIKAFFTEMIDDVENYRNNAITVYRKLSEYVHGNNETWTNGSIKITYKDELFDKYCNYYRTVTETILFSAMYRYSKLLDESERESLQFLTEEFNHILKIRELFGRS